MKILGFKEQVAESKDLEDELQNLVTYLKEHTESTAVYIGKVTRPKKPIKDEDDDTAHLNPDADPEIVFQFCSEEHESLLVDKVLQQNMGLTYDLFKEVPEGEEGQPADDTPIHIFVPEVVREERIHYFDVPKLGSYLAIKLEYESCLFEESFDAAFANYKEVQKKKFE